MTFADTFVALMNLVQGPVAAHLRTDAGVARLLRLPGHLRAQCLGQKRLGVVVR
jgi:hypothetical protein